MQGSNFSRIVIVSFSNITFCLCLSWIQIQRRGEDKNISFSIQFVFLNPVQEEHWCMNYDSENLFSLISIKFLSTGLIGWNSESKSNKYAERVVIGLVIQNSCHHFFYLSSTSVQKVSVRAAYLIW